MVVSAAGMTVLEHDHARAQRQARLRDPGQRRAELPGRRGAVARRRERLGALEAGQRPARHAAQRREPQLPEHRARHRLAHRPRHRARRTSRPASTSTIPASRAPRYSIPSATTCSWRWKPAAKSRWSMRRAATRSSASTSGRAPQGLAISDDGRRLYVNNFMDRTVGVFDLTRLLNLGESNVPALTTLASVTTEALTRAGAQGQADLLRRARPATGARRVHELRLLPQRWRPRRPHLGPHRHGRRPAQHGQPARPRGRAGLPALVRQLRRGAGLRRRRSARSPAARAS